MLMLYISSEASFFVFYLKCVHYKNFLAISWKRWRMLSVDPHICQQPFGISTCCHWETEQDFR